ncbi:hypothetical protein QYE76_060698 [Lolium multiflorum]|uniref:Transposase (putative) gypsy type domain-containing protein n=1 Tax=Lolium multiflorum TaxID=4521 RepID=A0AAD8S0W8_LOLMU|nr:hypothetical protein QYE76_060698 [Lolium multiflorum]
MISAHWSFTRDSDVPKPEAGEIVMTKAWVERGLSLPCSEFFLSILNTYGLQPHNICPNSYLLLSNFVTLCEGHLGIRPDVRLWQFFFRVKKETKDKAMVNCGSMTFMLRPGRMYPPHDSHESVRYWNAGWFYEKNASVPDIHDGLPKFINEPPEELASWSFVPSLAQTPILEKAARRISWLVHDGLTGAQLTLSCSTLWRRKTSAPFFVSLSLTRRRRFRKTKRRKRNSTPQAAPRPSKRPRAKASGSEAGASGEASAKKSKTEQQALHYELHKNIALQRRYSNQAENIRTERCECGTEQTTDAQGASSSLATASSELENLRSSYQELETKLKEAELKREQAEKQLAEKNSEHIREKGKFILKRNDDSETIKRQQKELYGFQKYMETAEHHWDLLNENILCNHGRPPDADVNALLDAGYDTRIARRIRHDEFYDKVVLPADEPWKPNFKRSATRRRDLRNPEPNLPGPAPRTLPKRNPRPALQLRRRGRK